MCGIIGIARQDAVGVDELLDSLANLEYRGYDSAGVAHLHPQLDVTKQAGRIGGLRETLEDTETEFRVGIGHTRWSTSGVQPSVRQTMSTRFRPGRN